MVGAQRLGMQLHATQFVAQHDLPLDLRTAVDDRDVMLAVQRDRCLERGVHGTASCKRPPAVAHARYETELERICDVQPACVPASLPRVGQELERRSAVAVLQVLTPQPVAMDSQQYLTLGARHDRHLLDLIARATASRCTVAAIPLGGSPLVSGRHMDMSRPRARRPPSQLSSDSPRAQAPTPARAPTLSAEMHMSISDRLHHLDRHQQQSRRLAFIAAVIKKWGDDQAGQLAALIAYYGFVSLFPLLLVLVTVLGFVLQGDPGEQKRILDGTLGQFPLISDQLKLQSLTGSSVGLAIGVFGSLLAGMGVTGATQNAFNRIWSVPFKDRPNFIHARLRGLGMLAILGTLSIVSTTAAGFVGSASHAAPAVVAGVLVAFVLNLALFMTAFKLLTAVDVSWRELLPGVIVAAVFWQLLQHLGGFYVDHELKRTGPLYGVFALVLGLLAWLYLGAQLTIFAAEINVVRCQRLWPRSFFSDPLLDADRRALTSSAEVEERVHEENVEVSFDGPE